ncbi:hypothetical protein [Endozoicomonas sp. 8E]|nr:hypothetical protein [Endozoicomonas sp. 8E]WOG28582.1 hypothetical protein P6910_02695 [Endozoicomonas sp. 8E]
MCDRSGRINAALPDGTTPLPIATRMGNTDCMELLITSGQSREQGQ